MVSIVRIISSTYLAAHIFYNNNSKRFNCYKKWFDHDTIFILIFI